MGFWDLLGVVLVFENSEKIVFDQKEPVFGKLETFLQHILEYIALVFFYGPKTKEIMCLWVQLARNSGTKTVFFIWKQNYCALK